VEGTVRINCLTILNPSEILVRNMVILVCLRNGITFLRVFNIYLSMYVCAHILLSKQDVHTNTEW